MSCSAQHCLDAFDCNFHEPIWAWKVRTAGNMHDIHCLANSVKADEANWGPLSEIATSGIPWRGKCLFKHRMTGVASVLVSWSTSIVNRYKEIPLLECEQVDSDFCPLPWGTFMWSQGFFVCALTLIAAQVSHLSSNFVFQHWCLARKPTLLLVAKCHKRLSRNCVASPKYSSEETLALHTCCCVNKSRAKFPVHHEYQSIVAVLEVHSFFR